MVYLSSIYTKSGDDGTTGLGTGERVPKDHPRVAAYGSVDELNATLGLLCTQVPDYPERAWVQVICNDLFDVGADLCMPIEEGEDPTQRLRVTDDQVLRLEHWIDERNAELEPLTSFVLPGGSPASAWLHLARTICRRAERDVVTLTRHEPVNPAAQHYLNRLSDLLFVLARHANDQGRADVLWEPGKGRGEK